MGLLHQKIWWSRMISFMLINFEAILKDIWLYRAIRNLQYSLSHSAYQLFSILEIYNPKFGTFFTLVGELSFLLFEMFKNSLLSIGEMLYMEIVPTTEELRQMKTQDSKVYETYWEMMCHLCVCQEVSGTRSQDVCQKLWAITSFKM